MSKNVPATLAEAREWDRDKLAKANKDQLLDIIYKAPDTTGAGAGGDGGTLATSIAEMVAGMRVLTGNQAKMIDSQANMMLQLQAYQNEVRELRTKVETLENLVLQQSTAIEQQQLYLEQMDGKERAKNFVIYGIPEDEVWLGCDNDQAKVNKILRDAGCDDVTNECHQRRVGKKEGGKVRPILITVDSGKTRNETVQAVKKLQMAKTHLNLQVKKDTHPAIRREWRRLFDAYDAAVADPDNAGCNIRLDRTERKLYRNGTVIDSWKPRFSYF